MILWAGPLVVDTAFVVFIMIQLNAIMHQSGDTTSNVYQLFGACLFGICGMVVTESLGGRSERERARIKANLLVQTNTAMTMATNALNTSQDALVVVDKQRTIVLLNLAFVAKYGNNKSSKELRYMRLEDALNLSRNDTSELICCFEDLSFHARDVYVGNGKIRVTLSTEPIDLVSVEGVKFFLATFNDV